MIVYFGATMADADTLLTWGLHTIDDQGNDTPPTVSTSEAFAGAQAASALIRLLAEQPQASETLALMLVIDVPGDRLRQSPQQPHLYALPGGCKPSEVIEWRRFDALSVCGMPGADLFGRHGLRVRDLTLEDIHRLRWTGWLGIPPDDELIWLRSAEGRERRRELRAAVPRDLSPYTRQADALQRDLNRRKVTCRQGHQMDWPDLIGRGNSRLVIALDERFVAKCSWPVDALGGFQVQNATEAAVWQLADEPTRDWLAPTVAVGDTGALVQMRGEPFHRLDGNYPTGAMAYALTRRLQVCCDRDDWVNFGGDAVLVDYANRVARRRPGVRDRVRAELERIEHAGAAAEVADQPTPTPRRSPGEMPEPNEFTSGTPARADDVTDLDDDPVESPGSYPCDPVESPGLYPSHDLYPEE